MLDVVYTSMDQVVGHSLVENLIHTNLQADLCICSAQSTSYRAKVTIPSRLSSPDGGICYACGGLTVRTGSCTTCTTCGTSGGCG
jgi:hypothetical protein